MKATLLYGEKDVRFEDTPDPKIQKPTDAILRLAASCVCGSDLWPFRGYWPVNEPMPMGHEYVGFVEEVGSEVKNLRKGQFVIGTFMASDNTCPHCKHGYPSSCENVESVTGAQAPYMRVPLADGTLFPVAETPDASMLPSMLAVSDVFGTGWYAADAAQVKPGNTVVVVGDGAVGLCGVLSAKLMGAERIIAMSRHASRQTLAKAFGATDIVEERGDEGVARVQEMTKGIGADSVLECVGHDQSIQQAVGCTRPGGHMSYVGVPHGVTLDGQKLFFNQINIFGGPAPVRHYMPELVKHVQEGADPGKVFDLRLPLADVAKGYAAMDERKAIKALLEV